MSILSAQFTLNDAFYKSVAPGSCRHIRFVPSKRDSDAIVGTYLTKQKVSVSTYVINS